MRLIKWLAKKILMQRGEIMDMRHKRLEKEEAIDRQLQFCMQLILKLAGDFKESREKQDNDSFDKDSYSIRYHSRYESDTVRLRRELNTLKEMFKGG